MENDTSLFKVECQMVPEEPLDEGFLYHEGSYSAGNKSLSSRKVTHTFINSVCAYTP